MRSSCSSISKALVLNVAQKHDSRLFNAAQFIFLDSHFPYTIMNFVL